MMLSDISERVHGTKDLPAFSSTGTKLLRMIADPDVTMQKIAAVVSMDPPLAAGVMRLANSAAYGFSERTNDLGTGVTRIGLRMLKTLVITSSVMRNVERLGKLAGLDRKGFWRYSLAAAIGARYMAHRTNPMLGDDAFLSALLHGIGITVLDVFFPDELFNAIDRVSMDRVPLTTAIQEQTGLGLGRIGAVLLDEWGIDEKVAQTVANIDAEIRDLDKDIADRVQFVRAGLSVARGTAIGKPIDSRPEDISSDLEAWQKTAERSMESLRFVGVEGDDMLDVVDKVKSDFSIFLGLAEDESN
ncbi:MAG: HDOD domain-containing protein [Planctomycetes bacterium]|nr:HDOD domain-containing protein [Planctomycetota bacterium]